MVAKGLPKGYAPPYPADGGRAWWAHFEFSRIDTTPTILPKKMEDLREARAHRPYFRRRSASSSHWAIFSSLLPWRAQPAPLLSHR
jgi:hypothetical protein